jgi:hypothetical protein
MPESKGTYSITSSLDFVQRHANTELMLLHLLLPLFVLMIGIHASLPVLLIAGTLSMPGFYFYA